MTESKSKKFIDINVKTFKDLDYKIIKTDKCCSCGACIAYCESQNFNVIEMNDYIPSFKTEKNIDNCNECGVCYYICPQTSPLLEKLCEAYNIKDKIGNIIKILSAKTTNAAIAKVGQDGGVVSTILAYLFDKHKIDAAIVSEFDKNLKPIPKIVFDKKDLLKSAGTRYSISPQIIPLKDLYHISHGFFTKRRIFNIDQLRMAFIGTPCQCRAISKMRFLRVKPAHVIKYIISLFCFENFEYNKLYDILRKETNVAPNNIKKTWIKKNFFISTKKNEEIEVDIKKLDPAIRKPCHECNEFTGQFSDISIGSSGAPKGYSMIITRTEIGYKIIKSLLSYGLIEQFIIPASENRDWINKKLNWYNQLISLKANKK
ncbi:MAG: Coenzyme F420 hydrogenase/dehydrogenase, beta subunit C-terminal domain [Promethearchaeota archaeon]|nr:MAG: Coenzyme F420 hydrogenase/dehydrogenase, beta subunit C-terminal domain [Candidatus Lokiarchaeota archaeon]